MDFIYVLCESHCDPSATIQAYDVSSPHDLLMITVVNEIDSVLMYDFPASMVGIENTKTLYLSCRWCSCIWKVDLVNNIVVKWLSELGDEFHLSVANESHLLVLSVSGNVSHLYLYDEEANLVRSVSLSNDFGAPLRAIQNLNGEFIVSHRSNEDNSMCVSFLNIEGKIIDQFKLKETVGFRDVKIFYSDEFFVAIEMFSGSVYILDMNAVAMAWYLTDYGVIFSNSSEDSSRNIVGVQSTNGRTRIVIDIVELPYSFIQSYELFWDTNDRYLVVAKSIFGDLHQLDTNTLKWRQILVGRKLHDLICMDYSVCSDIFICFHSYSYSRIFGILQMDLLIVKTER